MTFVDSNIPMYLVGASHPHRTDAQMLVQRLVAEGEALVTDAEVLQEILHRYTALARYEAIDPAIAALLGLVDRVFPIEEIDCLRAADIVQRRERLSARDAIHIAVMERHGITAVLSFDADFDRWPGLHRIHRI